VSTEGDADSEGMEKINVRVPQSLRAQLDDVWGQGGYANRSEFVRDALREAVRNPTQCADEGPRSREPAGDRREQTGRKPHDDAAASPEAVPSSSSDTSRSARQAGTAARKPRRDPPELDAERLLSSAIDELRDVFFVVSVDGTFLHWNDRLPEVTGYDDEEIERLQPTDFFEGEDVRRIENAIGRIVMNGTATEVAEVVAKDGRMVLHEFTGTLIDVGGTRAIVGTGRDIRERRQRQRELERRTERLEAINRVNAVIRELMAGLLAAESREEIAQTACETFAEDEVYRFAWFGSYDGRTEQVEPNAWAGEGEEYLDARPDGDGEGGVTTALTAVRDQAVVFAQDVEADPEADGWRSQALEYGHRSGAAIPVVYGDVTYGCLCLYADRPNAFGPLEREVFGELGEIVGHAIHAAEMRRALAADTVTELQFQITDEWEFLTRIAGVTDAELELVGSVEQPSGAIVHMFTVEGPEPDQIREFADAAPVEAEVVAAREGESVVKATLEDDTVSDALAEVGGTVRTITATGGDIRVCADLPPSANVEAVLEKLREVIDVKMLAQREVERDDTTDVEFRADVERHLTERQLEVLEVGLQAGFFEWPREQTGKDVAGLLDVSPPTFHQHLRVGQRKLLEVLFGEERSGDRTVNTTAVDGTGRGRSDERDEGGANAVE